MRDSNEPIALPTERTQLFGPADELATLRREQPLRRLRYTNGEVGWLVTSHALAKAVLTDSRFGRGDREAGERRSAIGDPARLSEFEQALEPYGDWRPMRGFIMMDPPAHTSYRRLLAPYFTARAMQAFRPRIEQIVAERLDVLEREGPPADLVSVVAAPVSLGSQCALLGVPAGEVERFFRLGTVLSDPAVPPTEAVAQWREAWEYVRALTRQKRAQPADDIISAIARHDELNDEDIADTALVLFQGGLETTGDMLALGTFVLLQHPEQLEALRADPSLAETAVEELLRYSGIFRLTARAALEDINLNGTLVKAGETVTVSLAAANRDPDKFEHPDTLELTRIATGHVAFAQGGHMCIGQHLARIELQAGLTGLLQRFPTLRLAVPADEVPVYGPHLGNFGVHELPVAW